MFEYFEDVKEALLLGDMEHILVLSVEKPDISACLNQCMDDFGVAVGDGKHQWSPSPFCFEVNVCDIVSYDLTDVFKSFVAHGGDETVPLVVVQRS